MDFEKTAKEMADEEGKRQVEASQRQQAMASKLQELINSFTNYSALQSPQISRHGMTVTIRMYGRGIDITVEEPDRFVMQSGTSKGGAPKQLEPCNEQQMMRNLLTWFHEALRAGPR